VLPERIAFLIGNQEFRPDAGLLDLRGPRNDVAALSRILRDPGRGRFTVREFLDKPRHEILPEIERTLGRAAPGDLVLIYYSGHGKLDRSGRVCLATLDTDEAALHATSIPARHLTDLVSQSDCDQVVLLLDCCYSGAIGDLRGDVRSEMHVIEDARGFYILTASTDHQTARETEPSAGLPVMGRFTAALVDGIESGSADSGRKGRILLSDLRQHVGQVVVGQTPQFFARRASGDPLISLSPESAAPLLDETVLADLAAESWHRRLGAVSYLVTTAREGSPPERQAAQAKLERHLLGERDAEVRKRIEEALSPRPEAAPPIAAREPKPIPPRLAGGRLLLMYALGVFAVAGLGLWAKMFFSTPTSSLVSNQNPSGGIPEPERNSGQQPQIATKQNFDNAPLPQPLVTNAPTQLVKPGGPLITTTANLTPGAPAGLPPGPPPGPPRRIRSIDWYFGSWKELPGEGSGFTVTIDRVDKQNATVRARRGDSDNYSGALTFTGVPDPVLSGRLFSTRDRFEPIECPPQIGQGKDCVRDVTANDNTLTFVRDVP
jgi:hypothetical protein